jgi:hypothetical protein
VCLLLSSLCLLCVSLLCVCPKVKVKVIVTDGQSVSKSWCRAPAGAHDQIFITVWQLRSCFCGAPSLTRGWVCLLYMLLSLCVCPFICCPSNRVFAPRKEDTSPHGFISRCCSFQQFGCLGILSRWVAMLISDVPCIWEVVA